MQNALALGEMFSGEQKREKVSSIEDIRLADILALRRTIPGDPKTTFYWHYAVVEEIHPESESLNIIHYQAGYGGAADLSNKSSATIARETMKLSEEDVYVVRLVPGCCLPPAEVLSNARSKLGEKEYSLVLNNCEHFALWCKTGIGYSSQVVDAISLGLKVGTAIVEAIKKN